MCIVVVLRVLLLGIILGCASSLGGCDNNPCFGGATCGNTAEGYICRCPLGFTGQTCSINIADCRHDTCNFNGNCRDGINSYTCVCDPQYTGKHCETPVREPHRSPCVDAPCENGGSCSSIRAEPGRYECYCTRGFTGKNCETKTDAPIIPGSSQPSARPDTQGHSIASMAVVPTTKGKQGEVVNQNHLYIISAVVVAALLAIAGLLIFVAAKTRKHRQNYNIQNNCTGLPNEDECIDRGPILLAKTNPENTSTPAGLNPYTEEAHGMRSIDEDEQYLYDELDDYLKPTDLAENQYDDCVEKCARASDNYDAVKYDGLVNHAYDEAIPCSANRTLTRDGYSTLNRNAEEEDDAYLRPTARDLYVNAPN